MSHSNIWLKRSQTAHLSDASEYIALYWSEYTPWIRLSTGNLTIELAPPEAFHTALVIHSNRFPTSSTSLLTPLPTFEIIDSISLVDYHYLCSWHLGPLCLLTVQTNMVIQLGSIRHTAGAEYESSLEIALSANLKVVDSGWLTGDPNIQDCWNLCIQFRSSYMHSNPRSQDNVRRRNLNSREWLDSEYRRYVYSDDVHSQGWLAQACHIFNSLDIKSNLEDYVLVNGIRSCLHLLGPIVDLPPGYLFLCPLAEFETDITGCFAIPDCTAYWSIDPSGAERLSAEQAKTLGLPNIDSWMEVKRRYWDSSDYDGICQFHEAKGFDPHSQDVAIELGYPLFQVSCQQDEPLAHLREVNTDEDRSKCEGMSVGKDHESISTNAEDPLDAEITSNFNSEMNESLAVVQDAEIVKGRTSGDLDGDIQVHEEASVLLSDRLEEEEVFAMLYC
ncbi:hypothetical protein K438DRAFT_1749652 [Mycena galopus ATCC 62051]|nr:hypothetical protein K438DRAFT_1749652 [Mycena galopus ATCC 62051]